MWKAYMEMSNSGERMRMYLQCQPLSNLIRSCFRETTIFPINPLSFDIIPWRLNFKLKVS